MHETFDRLRDKRRSEEGFTLIELLVVVVIIGILVAIAVPVYLNYRQGAADKSAQSDVRGAVSAIEQFYTDNANQYPPDADNEGSPGGDITLDGDTDQVITTSNGTTMVINVVGSNYAVCATNEGGAPKYWKYSNAAGGSVEAVEENEYENCAP